MPIRRTMSISPINNLSSNYIQSVLNSVLQGIGSSSNTTGSNLNGIGQSSFQLQSDNGQLSPFAQLLNTLQQLQQSDPTKYQQVTQQIATNLQSAAQTAQTKVIRPRRINSTSLRRISPMLRRTASSPTSRIWRRRWVAITITIIFTPAPLVPAIPPAAVPPPTVHRAPRAPAVPAARASLWIKSWRPSRPTARRTPRSIPWISF